MLIGGALLAFGGFRAWTLLGVQGIIPGLFGFLGLWWLYLGTLALVHRSRMAIVIDETGIELPAASMRDRSSKRAVIPRSEIVTIGKHESLKGRMIEVTRKRGDKVQIQVRRYCELDQFLSYCRQHNLPGT